MNKLLKGAYDLHAHLGPDVLPRKVDDLEMARRVVESGMAGIALKNHYSSTAERATNMHTLYPECDAVGCLVLNNSVGGINPIAVEMAIRAGAKIIFMPTTDGAYEQDMVFNKTPENKLPFWARLIFKMREEGVEFPGITICNEDGSIKKNVLDVLDVIAKHDVALESGHLSQEEVMILMKEAQKRGVKKIIITHVNYPGTAFSVEQQKQLVEYGAYIEHCYTPWKTGKISFEDTCAQIRAVGTSHVILGTDLGRFDYCYPDEGMLDFCESLIGAGFTEDEVHEMVVRNPRILIGKED